MEQSDAIKSAAKAIAEADAILVTAGAGMGVDSGLPDFRSEDGFWKSYPALKHLDLSFEDMAVADWFVRRPAMAWAFYGHRQALYNKTEPHPGFRIIRTWCDRVALGYFVFTSNVDGHFQKAGFPDHRVVECHGNIHTLQCSEPCTDECWVPEPRQWHIDLDKMNVEGDLPYCPHCYSVARPNVLMFMDSGWLPHRKREMAMHMQQWLDDTPFSKLVIIECGAGTTVSTVRRRSELIATIYDGTLIRINPTEPEVPDDAIAVSLPALEALTLIDKELQPRR